MRRAGTAEGGGGDARKPAQVALKSPRWGRDDLSLAALGVTLGLTCALFPWYIFFNPEKFGPPAVELGGGSGEGSGAAGRALADERMSSPLALPGRQGLPARRARPFRHGHHARAEEAPAPDADLDQPFPAAPPVFHLVHVENGRALIADEAGLWVVREGDALPDKSFVSRIGEEGGQPVLVTSQNKMLRLEE
jgi:hypothetical protein